MNTRHEQQGRPACFTYLLPLTRELTLSQGSTAETTGDAGWLMSDVRLTKQEHRVRAAVNFRLLRVGTCSTIAGGEQLCRGEQLCTPQQC